eukprot:4698251-Prymnesium_polylepis.1
MRMRPTREGSESSLAGPVRAVCVVAGAGGPRRKLSAVLLAHTAHCVLRLYMASCSGRILAMGVTGPNEHGQEGGLDARCSMRDAECTTCFKVRLGPVWSALCGSG